MLAFDLDGDAALRDALATSRWVARPAEDDEANPAMPLVLEGDLLYLRRYREYERRLAAGLRRIASATRRPASVASNRAKVDAIRSSVMP